MQWLQVYPVQVAEVTTNRKPGRPRRAKSLADERLELRLTKQERRAWERAAGELPLSEWVRRLCNYAAFKEEDV